MKEKIRIGDVCAVVSGSTPKTNVSEYWDGDIDWITPAELEENTFVVNESMRKITRLAVEKTGLKPFPKGTVILSSRAPIGKVAIAGKEMFCNQGFKNIICSESIYNEYLYWFLKGNTEYLNSLGRGATFKEISKGIVEDIRIALPSIDEQIYIADILKACWKTKIKQSRLLEDLNTLIKSRFVEMFGDISKGEYKYKIRKLGDVANVGSSHRVFTSEFVNRGIPFYRGTEIGELANGRTPVNTYYISKENYQRLANDETKPQIGDLLMPSICNKGQVWLVDTDKPFYYKDGRVLCISADREIYDTKYLQYYMKIKTEIEYPKLGSGSTFAEYKIFLLKDLDIMTPPRGIQEQFAAFVHQVDKLKVEVKKTLDDTQILFDSLMQQYFG